jgi:multiple sugar transport system permease protein
MNSYARHLLALPGLAALGLLAAAVAYTAYISLYDLRLVGSSTPRYVGVGNYVAVFSDPTFQKALVITGAFVVAATLAEVALGTVLAYYLFWQTDRSRRLLTALLAVPLLVPSVAYVVFWRYVVDFRRGVLVPVAKWMGVSLPNILGSPDLAFWAIVGLDVLQLTPFVVLIVLAGFLGVPQEVVNAARIDGARGLSMAVRVVLPMAKYAILAVLFLRAIDALRIFVKVWLLTRGGHGDSTNTMELYLYTRGIVPLDLGVAGAASVVLMALAAVVALPYIYMSLKTWRA